MIMPNKLALANIQIALTPIEYWLLLDNTMNYTDVHEYVWNAKWHLWAGCDNYCNNEHARKSI